MKRRFFKRALFQRIFAVIIFLAAAVFPAGVAHAYPDNEALGSGGVSPPFDFSVTSTYSGFLLTSDRRMAISYGESLKLVDLGYYALESSQPPALTSDDETDGIIDAIWYDSRHDHIIASQDDGDILIFNLADITANPLSITVAEDIKLGPLAANSAGTTAYVAETEGMVVHVVDLLNSEVTTSITLTIPGQSSFIITDAIFVEETSEVYFATDSGRIFYFSEGATSASRIDVDTSGVKELTALDAFPDGSALYIVDNTTPAVVRVRTDTHAIVKDDIDISLNKSPDSITITEVKNPSGTYAYVGGEGGLSVINTANDDVLDLGSDPDKQHEPLPVSAKPLMLASSSSTDGYVYTGMSNSKVGVVTANPFITINSVVYSGGGSSMGVGESFTITFTSDQDGTYTIKSGGSVDGGGTTLTDSSGNASGLATADTAVSVTINYNDNSSAFIEGSNDVWVFVNNGTETGRRACAVSVDTPPPNVVISSIGFGNSRIYVNYGRLTAEDMSHYNIYVDTDPAAVLVKTDAAAAPSQASSGSSQTTVIGGLVNGTTYYIAMEGVDAAGNVSPQRTSTFPDGSIASGLPEETVGPAGMMGEKGCSTIPGAAKNADPVIFVFASLIVLLFARYARSKLMVIISVVIVSLFFLMPDANAQEGNIAEQDVPAATWGVKTTPQMWSIELKTGFWIPQNRVLDQYFTACCNLITRIQGGLLLHKRYGIELGAGFLYKSADALGVNTGRVSQDRFNFILFPLETNFVWRADYFDWRYLVPYTRTGLDYVIFREGNVGSTTKGVKFGMHGGGGVAINVGEIGDVRTSLDNDFGINDLFITLEATYQWINNFGAGGLDLSGGVYSIGMLFEF